MIRTVDNLPEELAREVKQVIPLAGDASTRRFFRLVRRKETGGGTWILMDYGAPFQGETDDMILTRLFQAAGLPVPGIVSAWPDHGLLVLEDAGQRSLEEALAGDSERSSDLYAQVVGLAADIAVRGTPILEASSRSRSPCLDADRFRFEMEYFLEHYYCGLEGRTPGGPAFERLRTGLFDLADQAAAVRPLVLCHRDYHSRNLVLSPEGSLAMVDIQDARHGPLGYDLASLLWNPYSPIHPPTRKEMIGLFCEKIGLSDPDFGHSLEILALQRMIKALGTFGYQIGRLGKGRYRSAVPVTLKEIEQLPSTRALLPGWKGE